MPAPTPIATPSHLCRCLAPAQDVGIKRKKDIMAVSIIVITVLFFISHPPFECLT